MGDHIEEKASREPKEKKMTPLAEKAVSASPRKKNDIASAMMIVSVFSWMRVKKSLAIPHARKERTRAGHRGMAGEVVERSPAQTRREPPSGQRLYSAFNDVSRRHHRMAQAQGRSFAGALSRGAPDLAA